MSFSRSLLLYLFLSLSPSLFLSLFSLSRLHTLARSFSLSRSRFFSLYISLWRSTLMSKRKQVGRSARRLVALHRDWMLWVVSGWMRALNFDGGADLMYEVS